MACKCGNGAVVDGNLCAECWKRYMDMNPFASVRAYCQRMNKGAAKSYNIDPPEAQCCSACVNGIVNATFHTCGKTDQSAEIERLRIDLAAADKALNERTQERDEARASVEALCQDVQNLHATLARVEAALQEKDRMLDEAMRKQAETYTVETPPMRFAEFAERFLRVQLPDGSVKPFRLNAVQRRVLEEMESRFAEAPAPKRSDPCSLCRRNPADVRFYSPVSGERCEACAREMLKPKGYAWGYVATALAAGAGSAVGAWYWLPGMLEAFR